MEADNGHRWKGDRARVTDTGRRNGLVLIRQVEDGCQTTSQWQLHSCMVGSCYLSATAWPLASGELLQVYETYEESRASTRQR